MKPNTLRLYQTLHTWVGLMAGWALFIAFFAGAITVFHEELHAWQSPARISGATHGTANTDPAEVDRFVKTLIATHPDAAVNTYISLPNDGEPEFHAYWQDKAGEWHGTSSTKIAEGKTAHEDTWLKNAHAELANFLNQLHYSLGIPDFGIYFMGVISVLYGIAIVSGVLLHLPRLKKDLFAVRPGRNLKKFWMDMHNVLGLFSLPFHLVFAITGALLCLSLVLMMAFNTLTFDGKLSAAIPRITTSVDEVKAADKAAALLPADRLLAIARENTDDNFKPNSLRYMHIGDANAQVEVRGSSERVLGHYGAIGIRAAADQPESGQILNNQTAGARDTNHALYSGVLALHYGAYGDLGVRIVYLLAGLAGAFVFYSGNLLWIESRRKLRQAEQPRVHRLLAQATVGVCIGCCVGISAMFISALLWPERAVSITFYAVFAACIAWALVRPPVRAAIELLYTAAVVSVLVPVANALITGDHLLRTIGRGDWAVAGFDLGALVLAVGYIALARVSQRRARSGPADSVWATAPSGDGAAAATGAVARRPASQPAASSLDRS